MSDTPASPGGEAAAGADCPRCHGPVLPGEERAACAVCGSAHHLRCWSEAGERCALCAGAAAAGADPYRPPSAAPAAPGAKPNPDEVARELAEAALDDPLFPSRGIRCPRCGEQMRVDAPKDAKAQAAEAKAGAAAPAEPETCPRCQVALRSAEAGRNLVPTGRWWADLLRGALYVPRGGFYILRSPSLWKLAAVPLILNVIVAGLAFFLAFYVVGDWLQEVTGPDRLDQWTGWFWGSLSYVVFFLGLVVRWLSVVLLPLLATWLIVAFPFNVLYKILFMPFMELLTEATERKVLSLGDESALDFARFYANLIVAIVDAIILTLVQGLLYLVLLPLALVPGLNVLWLVLPPATFAGMDYSDINLVRRSYVTREKIRLWSTHRWRFFGFGVSFFFLLAVPVVNCVVIPAAAAGGALLYLELQRK